MNTKISFLVTRFTFILIFSSFLLVPLKEIAAQTKIERQIKTGLNYLYNFDFKHSLEIFNQLINKYPEHPAGYHYKSIVNLWYFLDQKRDKDKSLFLDLSDTVTSKCEKIINEDGGNAFIYFLLGSTYSYRAMIYARDEEYLNVLWSTKESYKYLDKALEADSTYYDAYLGLGLYNFAASQTPPAWKWALDLTDITGDKKLGVKYLELASKKGYLAATEAKFYLSQVMTEFIMDYFSANKILASLLWSFPNNNLFRYSTAVLNIKDTKLQNAERYLRTIIKSGDTSFIQIKTFSFYQLGNIFFIKNDFDSAKTLFRMFIDNTIDEHYYGAAALKLAYCFEFLNEPDSASKYYEMTNRGNEDLDEDVYAAAMGEKYLENPPGAGELNLIKIQNLADAGDYKSAIDSALKMVAVELNDSLRAQLYLVLSDVYYKIKKYSLSLDYAISVINNEEAEEWMKAYACFYSARTSLKMKKRIDAELFINYANKYNDFVFENRLRNSLHALLYQIKE